MTTTPQNTLQNNNEIYGLNDETAQVSRVFDSCSSWISLYWILSSTFHANSR